MVFTSNDDKDAFKHVMFNVLDVSTSDKMVRARKDLGLDWIMHLILLTDEDLSNLRYTDEKGEKENIPCWQINNVRCFIGYMQHRHKRRDPIGDGYLTITKEQLDLYRVSPNFHTYIRTPRPSELSPSDKVYDAVASFRRGIKRDPSLFVIFRDESNFDSWQRSLTLTAPTQAVNKVPDLYTLERGG